MMVDHFITEKNGRLDVETFKITCDYHQGDTRGIEVSRRGAGCRTIRLDVEHRLTPIPRFEFDVKVARELAGKLIAMADAIEGVKHVVVRATEKQGG
jgi:hypothetical protein